MMAYRTFKLVAWIIYILFKIIVVILKLWFIYCFNHFVKIFVNRIKSIYEFAWKFIQNHSFIKLSKCWVTYNYFKNIYYRLWLHFSRVEHWIILLPFTFIIGCYLQVGYKLSIFSAFWGMFLPIIYYYIIMTVVHLIEAFSM